MDGPNLLVNVDCMQLTDVTCVLAFRVAVKTVEGDLLPPSLLLFRDRLASDSIKQIAPLTRQSLEVVGDIRRGQICRGESCIRLGLLLFPSWIEKLD